LYKPARKCKRFTTFAMDAPPSKGKLHSENALQINIQDLREQRSWAYSESVGMTHTRTPSDNKEGSATSQ
jgi:hypothetical protein